MTSLLLTMRNYFIAHVSQGLARHGVLLFLFFILFVIFDDYEHHVPSIALTVFVGIVVCLGLFVGAFYWLNKRKLIQLRQHPQSTERSLDHQWSRYGMVLFFNTSMYALVAFIDLLIVELIPHHGEHNVGYYAACLTILAVMMIPVDSTRQVVKPIFASQIKDSLKQRVINVANLFQLSLLVFLVIAIVFYSKVILATFGVSYMHFSGVLNVLAVGVVVSLFPSMCIFELLYQGHKKVLLINSTLNIGLTISLGSLAYHFFGLIGLAYAMVLIKNLVAYGIFIYVKTKTKLKYLLFI